jgi:hypothetical protein
MISPVGLIFVPRKKTKEERILPPGSAQNPKVLERGLKMGIGA